MPTNTFLCLFTSFVSFVCSPFFHLMSSLSGRFPTDRNVVGSMGADALAEVSHRHSCFAGGFILFTLLILPSFSFCLLHLYSFPRNTWRGSLKQRNPHGSQRKCRQWGQCAWKVEAHFTNVVNYFILLFFWRGETDRCAGRPTIDAVLQSRNPLGLQQIFGRGNKCCASRAKHSLPVLILFCLYILVFF